MRKTSKKVEHVINSETHGKITSGDETSSNHSECTPRASDRQKWRSIVAKTHCRDWHLLSDGLRLLSHSQVICFKENQIHQLKTVHTHIFLPVHSSD